MQGFEREDGTRETLPLDDIGRCFRASAAIRQRTVTGALHTFQAQVSPACKKQQRCVDVLRGALEALENVSWLLACCPLRLTVENLLDYKGKLGTCTECTTMVRERRMQDRMELWDQLPKLLDVEVPGWGEDGGAEGEAS